MKLFFEKNVDGDILAKIQEGTIPIEFDYVKMINQLMSNNVIDDPDFNGVNDEEQAKIKEMLEQIRKTVAENLAVE